MKKIKSYLLIVALAGLFASCGDDYLTSSPSTDVEAGAPATLDVVQQNVTSAYAVMNFDDYANSLWMPVNLFFDVATDDLFAGGADANDQLHMQLFANFSSTPTNSPSGWWSIFYSGLKRCNGALDAIQNVVGDVDPKTMARLKAEVLTLRAYYVHWLWKAYGNIPYFDKPWAPDDVFIAKQYTFDEIYPIILADLDAAIAEPEFPMSDNMGRVTKSMAMMTKARVVMYYKDESKYAEVLADMKTIIDNGAFSLVTTAKQPTWWAVVTIRIIYWNQTDEQ